MGGIANRVIEWARAQHFTLDTLIAVSILVLTVAIFVYALRSDESQKKLLEITRKMGGAFPSIVFEVSKPPEEARLKCVGLLRNTGKSRTTVTGYMTLSTGNSRITKSTRFDTALLPEEAHQERFELLNSEMEEVRSGREKLELLCHIVCITADGNKEEKEERYTYKVYGNTFIKAGVVDQRKQGHD